MFIVSTGQPKYSLLSNLPLQQLRFGWTEISGDFHAPTGKFTIVHWGAAVLWLKYCPYGVKHYPINPSTEVVKMLLTVTWFYNIHVSGATIASPYIQIADTEVNFLLDAASATELNHDPHWLTEANQRINKLRKAPISFKWVNICQSCNSFRHLYLNEYHITFLQFSCGLTWDYLAYILRGKLNKIDLILIVQNDNM